MVESRIAVRTLNSDTSAEREQRPADRAEAVHRALEPVGPDVRVGGDQVGEQRVSGRYLQAAGRPRRPAQHTGPHDRRRGADQTRQHRGRGVAADRNRLAPLGVVGQRAADEASRPGQALGAALDEPERGRRSPERSGHEPRHQRGGHLVTHVGKKTRRPDTPHTRGQLPPPPTTRGRRLHRRG